jgi:hypothetical protein
MINAVNTNPVQTVQANANVLFNATNVRTNSCKGCRGWLNFNAVNSGIFEITKPGIYFIHFNANVSPTVAGQITVNITNAGENIIGGEMQTPGTTPDTFENIASGILVVVPCNCCDIFTIKNSTAEAVDFNNPSLTIFKLA